MVNMKITPLFFGGHASSIRMFVSGLKLGQVIQVKQVAFCVGQPGQTQIIKVYRSDPDLVLTALLEYFDLLVQL